MSWIYYLLEANLYLAAFYLVYYFVLRHETYYQLNRAYLLAACLVAFVIPLMQIGSLRKYSPPPPPPMAPTMVLTEQSTVFPQPIVHLSTAHVWTTADYYLLAYTLVAVVMLIAFAIKLFKLIQLSRKAKQATGNGFYLVEIADDNNAFSFFKYLFIDPKMANSAAIMQHELVHIRQRHSLDIVFLELFKIVNWFNPAVYLLQNSLKELHEFIADQETASQQQDVNGYTDFLIHNAYGFAPSTLTNNFFNKNLLKTRIIMLHQKRSGSLARLKLLLILPLCAGLLCASTLAFSKSYGYVDLLPNKGITAKTTDTVDKRPPPPPPAPPHGIKYAGKQMPPPPPPPMFLNPEYIELGIYMQNHLKYPQVATANGKTGLVILNFRLDEQHMITDVKVEKSIGSGLDEEAIRLILGYKKAIKDKPGYHTIGLNFNIKGTKFIETVTAEAKDKPGFVGELLLPGHLRFPPPVVKADVALNAPPKPKVDQVRFPPPVVKADVAHQNPPPPPPPKPKVDQVRFPPPVVKADGKNAPPKPKVDQIRFPPPVVRPDDTVGAAAFSDFYAQAGKFIRYAADMRDNNIQGKVWVIFNVDDDRRIRNIKIIRGLTETQNMEVVNRLSNITLPQLAKPGVNYTMPITFKLQTEDGKEVKNMPFTKGKTYAQGYKPNNYPYKSLNEVVIVGYGK